VRGLEERFLSRVLPLFARRTREIGELLPALYLHGLSKGDFELALRGLLGDGAPLSPSSLERLKAKWQDEFEEWTRRSLADRELVSLWADGVYVKAGLEREKAALLVVIGAMRDGRKEVLASFLDTESRRSPGWDGEAERAYTCCEGGYGVFGRDRHLRAGTAGEFA
jgi:transposase-like protein